MAQLSGLSYNGWNIDTARAYEWKQVRIKRTLEMVHALPEVGRFGYQELRSAAQLEALTESNFTEFVEVWRALVPRNVPNQSDLYDLREMLLLGRATPAEVRELMGAVVDTRPWYGR